MAVNPEWLRLLRKVFIFTTFTGDQLGQVAKKMKLTSLPKGAVLFKRGDKGDALYLIVSGSLRLVKEIDTANTNRDPHNTIAYLDRGDVLGEMAVLAGDPYYRNAVVESTAELLVLKKDDFDALLNQDPTMGIHLSRILSGRLSEVDRGEVQAPTPAKFISLIPALGEPEQVVFATNLGVRLVEQTRRRVLLVCVGCGHENLLKGLKLPPSKTMTSGTLTDVKKLEPHISTHPSGLEVMGVDAKNFQGVFPQNPQEFFRILKDNFDICLFVLPPKLNEASSVVLLESKRCMAIMGMDTRAEDRNELRHMEQTLPQSREMEKVWLHTMSKPFPEDFNPSFRIAWNSDWGRHFMRTGNPHLPYHAILSNRHLDRLARSLGDLTIGFAMGSGAAYGYALIGMLRVFEREGIFPDVISGTSMGALIGSFYASGLSPDELTDVAEKINRKRLWRMIELSFPRSGILTGRGVLQFLRQHLKGQSFADMWTPFACVATDIENGHEIVLDKGNVAEAVRASLSLPFFFRPHYLGGRYLVDGGLVNPVPTSIVVNMGANIIISANLTSKAGEKQVPKFGFRRKLASLLHGPAIPEILLKTIYIMQYEVAMARSEISHVVMHINAGGRYLWWDFDQAKDIIRLGEAAAEESLPKIKSLLPYYSDSCKIRLRGKGLKFY